VQLRQLIQDQQKLIVSITGNTDVVVLSICQDSRVSGKGDVFVAIKGTLSDGHKYIPQVIEQGTRVIVAEINPPDDLMSGVVWIKTHQSDELMGQMAAAWHSHPTREMQVIGVTGTNGKTTIATLLYQAWTAAGHNVGLVSTVENRIKEKVIVSTHTTPDAIRLQALFAEMRDAGCTHVFMEVSSHAVHQRRIAGTRFVGGVFTNLTHDHLDYHGTFAEYLKAKKGFFDLLPKEAFAVTNLDDRNGRVMMQNTAAQVVTYALRCPADVKGKVIENALSGLHMQINEHQIHARIMGGFNASNLLAVYAVSTQLGMDSFEALTVLSNLRGAEGRFEYLAHPRHKHCGAVIDYAHTPDALEKVLQTIKEMQKKSGRMITVVGCGGDRDRTKRAIMGKIAQENSHLAIFTSDNPRTEDPEAILKEMTDDLDQAHTFLTITDRKQAIAAACQMLTSYDVLLVAGKGHEKYQEIQGVKHPFDDKEVLLAAMK
jgi:UDP-N-acetylmuramoyl-L-alanyl-D-glutamate--2,6-diaminopimelate ligase